jgi:type I restriction enzyme R subunit
LSKSCIFDNVTPSSPSFTHFFVFREPAGAIEQRVNKALMKVKSDRPFTEEQNEWLELIRRHLIENLLMEKEDVETLPIFTREGISWAKLNKAFDGKLETIIHEINEAIAA